LTAIDLHDIDIGMPAEDSFQHALHAIADPTRRRILHELRENAKTSGTTSCLCAGDIEARMQLSQPTISHHMAILTKAGLVETTKQGLWRRYRRNEKAIRQIVKALRGKL
jgi:ArsR family transcriptional regulator, arsenate/arsenite/antimonite-responsive transcriptional repressor